jgi:hypothetical protein
MLWEAVFLFHKCAHTQLAALRLANLGMQSWSMFNAYHSAFLGARGIMALLGVGLPNIRDGGQLLVDVFPEPESQKKKKQLRLRGYRYEEILIVYLSSPIEQHETWECFQRVVRMSTVECWNNTLSKELVDLDHKSISKRRNAFLYRAAFWPADDLMADGVETGQVDIIGTRIDSDHAGFLLRLSCAVYSLFEELISDIATVHGVIRSQFDESRIKRAPDTAEPVS